MKNRILEISIDKSIACSAEVAFWNYWDHEHLDIIHSSYKQSDILYDAKNFLFRVDKIKIPLFPFLSSKTPIFMVQHNKETMYTFAIQFGILSKTTITIKSLSRAKCKINMNYKFHLEGWRIILKPLLKKMILIWNEKVWQEDLPVKLRRQKVLDMNFKDFIGMPENFDERSYEGKINFKPPIPRPKKSTRDKHPLTK